jgi:hypothetical protein
VSFVPLVVLGLLGAIAFDLDGDGRADRIEVTDDGRVTALGREERIAGSPAEIDAAIARGRRVVLVTTPREALLLGWNGALEVLWRGPAGAADVDGEVAVRVELRDGQVVRYRARADVTGCDGAPLPIAAEAFDVAARRFRAVAPAPTVPADAAALARGAGLAESARPAVFRLVSSTADDGAPGELEDGDPTTDGPAPLGATFVARGSDAYRLAALRVRGRGVKRLIVRAGERAFVVDGPGWFAFPADVRARCVSFTVAAGAGRLGEVALFTELEASGGAAGELADRVAAGDDGAARLLAAWGEAGTKALAARAARATPAERRRLAAALARIPAAPDILAATLADPPDGVRAALVRLGRAAVPALVAALADPDEKARIAAVDVLGAIGAIDALAPRLGAGSPAERAAVVRALADKLDAAAALRLARGAAEPDAWLVVAAAHGDRAAAAAAAAARLRDATGYELRYRLAQAAARLEAWAAVTALLAAEPEPAIRAAAVTALPARPGARAVADAALADPDAGVRLEALATLARFGDSADDDDAVAARLHDAWPIIRRAAADALAARCARRAPADALVAAAPDPDATVARAVLAALVRCREPRAGALLLAAARDAKRGASLRAYAASLLGPGQAAELLALFDQARRDAIASDDALLLAEGAARALGKIGGADAAAALMSAAGDPTLPVLQASALAALAEACAPGAVDAARRAAGSSDALVVRAARLVKKRCAPAP